MSHDRLRALTYRPRADRDERTIAAWLIRAVLALPASLDSGQAAAQLGVSPCQVRAIRDHTTQR